MRVAARGNRHEIRHPAAPHRPDLSRMERCDMVEKPPTADDEQRRAQTRAAREQSGLPPEQPDQPDETGPEPGSDPARRGAARTKTSPDQDRR
jgi:hypothetical protein